MSKYLDEEGLAYLWGKVANEDKLSRFIANTRIADATCIYRTVQFIDTESTDKEYMQGGCVFPSGGNWDTGTLHCAYITNRNGADTDCVLHIVNLATRAEVATVTLDAGHNGSVTYTDGKIVVPIYTNDTSSPQVVKIYDVTTPSAPTIYLSKSWATVAPNVTAFQAYKDTKLIGYGAPADSTKTFGMYTWDYVSDTVTWLYDVSPTINGKRMQPGSYDETHDVYIWPFADCTGYTVFDMDGNAAFHKTFESQYGFITVGEVESVCIHGGKIWFMSNATTSLGTVITHNVFEYDVCMGGFGVAPQGRTTYDSWAILLDATNGALYPVEAAGYSTGTNVTLMVPDDACNMAKYLAPKRPVTIVINTDYSCAIAFVDIECRVAFGRHIAARGYYFSNFNGSITQLPTKTGLDPANFMSQFATEKNYLATVTDSDYPVYMLFMNCNISMWLDSIGTITHNANYYYMRIVACDITAYASAGHPLRDSIIDASRITFTYMQTMEYCLISSSVISGARVLLSHFDETRYRIINGTRFTNCFLGSTGTTSLLPSTAYYVGALADSIDCLTFQALAGSNRLGSVVDRMHSFDIPYGSMTITARVTNGSLTLTCDDTSVTAFVVWA